MSTPLPYQVAEVSVGKNRYANRDGSLVWPPGNSGLALLVALVCDAPDAADETTPRQVQKLAQNWLEKQFIGEAGAKALQSSWLVAQLASHLNNQLKELNRTEGQERYLCTLTIAFLEDDKAHLLCVGDSPWAHLRPLGGGDFSYSPHAETSIFSGPYRKTDSSITSRSSGQQTAFIGRESCEFPPTRVSTVELRPGDWIFLMSDGLEKMVPQRRLVELALESPEPESLKDRVNQKYLADSLTDDVTFIAVRVTNELPRKHSLGVEEVTSLVQEMISGELNSATSLEATLTRIETALGELLSFERLQQQELNKINSCLDGSPLSSPDLSSRLDKIDNLINNANINLENHLKSLPDRLQKLEEAAEAQTDLAKQILKEVAGLASPAKPVEGGSRDNESEQLTGLATNDPRTLSVSREQSDEEPQMQPSEPIHPPIGHPTNSPWKASVLPTPSTNPLAPAAEQPPLLQGRYARSQSGPQNSRSKIIGDNHKKRWRFASLLLLLLLAVSWWLVFETPWRDSDQNAKVASSSPVLVSEVLDSQEEADGERLSLFPETIWMVPPISMRLTSQNENALQDFLAVYRSALANSSLRGASAEDLGRLWPAPVMSGERWKVEVSYFKDSIPTKNISVQPGDALDRLEKREKTDRSTLYSLNEREKLDNLRAGDKLRIPSVEGISLRLFLTLPMTANGQEPLGQLGTSDRQEIQSFYDNILKMQIPKNWPFQVPYGVTSAAVEYPAKRGDTVALVARRFHLTPLHLLWLNRDRKVTVIEAPHD